MNILHIMKDYKPNVGGSVIRNGNMIDTYLKCFQDNIIVLNLDGKLFDQETYEDGVRVIRCKSLKEMIVKAIRIIKKEKIDIIQTHNFRFLMVGFIAKLFSKKKSNLCVELHAIYNTSSYKKVISQFFLQRAEIISVLSQSAKDYLVSEKKINSDRIIVLRNGSSKLNDVEERSEIRDELEKYKNDYCIVGYTGSFISWQGVRFLAENYDNIIRNCPNIFLVMLGDGPEFDYVNNIISKSQYKKQALIHHGVSKAKLYEIMKEIDIVIIPREKNLCTNTAVPLKAIEAMQLGKCIVASDDNGLKEVLNSANSRIFEANNEESLIRELSTVVNDKKYRISIGNIARKDAENIVRNWEDNANDLHNAYMRLRQLNDN